jgi:hypothetical protein
MEAIPSVTDEAGPEFLTRALREGGAIGANTEVVEVEHEPIGVGVGIVGQLARLQLRYRGPAVGAPGTVILKLPSQFPENRFVGDRFNFYEREARFYQQLAEKLPLRVARCYWNHIDPEGGRFGLVLEDLGQRTLISQIAGIDAGRAEQALLALGRLHGTWWGSPQLDGLDWMPRLDDPLNLAAGQQYREAWPLFLERMGPVLPDGAVRLGQRVQLGFEEVLRASTAEAPATVCHGDFRADNLLFDDSATAEDGVAVLDWQISVRGPAIGDVAYFLCQSVTVDDRRRHEEHLVRAWYGAVVESAGCAAGAGLPGYPLELAWDQYRRAVLITTVYPVTAAGAMDPANERGRELIAAMAERAFAAAIDLGSEEFLASRETPEEGGG